MSLPTPQHLIGGRFRVEGTLGAGGMGAVYLARNVDLDQLVAVKVLHPDVAGDDVRKTRLIREARVAARIKSPHVVRVFDVVAEGPDAPYVVMEYLKGESLRSLLERRGRLSLAEVMELLSQVGEAIGEGHALGIVHRDIKPENIFCVSEPKGGPFYKVLDFGISKVRDPGAETLTSSRQVLASPAYAAPEQLRSSRDADVPADLWGIGVLLYECLVGTRPFTAETLGHLCVQILESTPAAPSERVSGLPKTIDDAVLRCLAKAPEQRFSSVAALLHACASLTPNGFAEVLAYLGSAPGALPVERTLVLPKTTTSGAVVARSQAEAASPPKSKAPIFLLGGAALAAVSWWAVSSRQQAPTPPGPVAAATATAPLLAPEPKASTVPSAAPSSVPPATMTAPVGSASGERALTEAPLPSRPQARPPVAKPKPSPATPIATSAAPHKAAESPRWTESR